MKVPEPRFDHLRRLTDDTGLLEHAWYAVPRRRHGYTTDDNARALLAVCREDRPGTGDLAPVFLGFLRHAQVADGRFRNRLSYQRRWLDEGASDDANGRALWGLGTATRRAPEAWIREAAGRLLRHSAGFTSPHPRSTAFAVLGAVEALDQEPRALELLERNAPRLARPLPDRSWPWPEPRLAYDNARLAEGLIAAGLALDLEHPIADGLRLLDWLVEQETRGGNLSLVPHRGWARGEPRRGFDQQPLEAAALADAALRAWQATGDRVWVGVIELAAGWFLGRNDLGVAMWDPETGGAYDGLTPSGPNLNQGAESTLALITTLQQARELRRGALRAAGAR